jgi:hypothetical protein
MNQEYLLTGGTGTAIIDFTISSPAHTTASPSCSFSFNGVAAPMCNPVADTFSETVEYGVPFTPMGSTARRRMVPSATTSAKLEASARVD